MMPTISYRDAGVDIDAGDKTASTIGTIAQSTSQPGVMAGIGGFASLFRLQDACPTMQDPVLVSGTDGVGTKLLIAQMANRYDTLGQDLVAMCVNDVLVYGAKPLFFLDYFATGKLESAVLLEIVSSISAACKKIGCALVGGETAEMPGLYAPGHFDIAGFCVGVVDRHHIIDGKTVRPGDSIIGLSSSGLHSNGFSLVRKIMGADISEAVLDTLLTPTTLYVNPVMALLEQGFCLKALAHITGGGLLSNMTRTIPNGLDIVIDRASWVEPPIFDVLRKNGPVSDEEMQNTFNLGIGFTIITNPFEANEIVDTLKRLGAEANIIGYIRETL